MGGQMCPPPALQKQPKGPHQIGLNGNASRLVTISRFCQSRFSRWGWWEWGWTHKFDNDCKDFYVHVQFSDAFKTKSVKLCRSLFPPILALSVWSCQELSRTISKCEAKFFVPNLWHFFIWLLDIQMSKQIFDWTFPNMGQKVWPDFSALLMWLLGQIFYQGWISPGSQMWRNGQIFAWKEDRVLKCKLVLQLFNLKRFHRHCRFYLRLFPKRIFPQIVIQNNNNKSRDIHLLQTDFFQFFFSLF